MAVSWLLSYPVYLLLSCHHTGRDRSCQHSLFPEALNFKAEQNTNIQILHIQIYIYGERERERWGGWGGGKRDKGERERELRTLLHKDSCFRQLPILTICPV